MLRKKLDSLVKGSHSSSESPQKQANLEVPKQYPLHSPDQATSELDDNLAITVPSKTCIVAPWESTDSA